MMNPLLLLIPLISLLSLFTSSFAIASNNFFVECLASNKIPFYTNHDNPNFTTILNSTIRNLRYNLPTTRKPTTILAPTTAAQVSAAVVCAKKNKTLILTRSGGHDYEGLSYVADSEFVILDMFNFRNITINVPNKSAWVDSGAQLGELYYQISRKTNNTLAFPGGVCPTVGVGGHLSGAGYGTMIRNYGLTVDHVVDATIVVANGDILDRKSMGEDLFWAIRGGGGASFGVILSWKINLVPVPEKVTVFKVYQFMSEYTNKTLYQYQEIMPTIDRRLFVRALLQPQTVNKTKTVRTTFIGMFLGNAESLLNITSLKFPKLGLSGKDCEEMTWIESVLSWANFDNLTSHEVLLNRTSKVEFLKRKSDYVRDSISVYDLTRIFKKLIEVQDVGLVFNSYGGKMNEVSEHETPFPHRRGNIFKIQYSLGWKNANETGENLDGANRVFEFMTPFVSKNPRRAYLNYRDLDIGTNKNGKYDYGVKYFKKRNFERLVRIKTAVDPENFFRNEQSIPTKSLLKKGASLTGA